MHRRTFLASSAVAGLAGCSDVTATEVPLTTEEIQHDDSLEVAFLDEGRTIAGVGLRWPEVHPLMDADVPTMHGNVHHAGIHANRETGYEWASLDVTVTVDTPTEPPLLYLQVDHSTPVTDIERFRDGTTRISVADPAQSLSIGLAVIEREEATDGRSLSVDVDLVLVENGVFETQYRGEGSITSPVP